VLEEPVVAEDGSKQTRILRSIELTGDLTPEQVENLKSIANKCPIHKLLEGPKQIATEVAHKS